MTTENLSKTISINVALGNRTYPIYIGENVLAHSGEFIRAVLPATRRLIIISNPTVFAHYGGRLKTQLQLDPANSVDEILIPDGEAHKTMATLEHIVTRLLELHADRSSAIVALGGGVVGDIAGFAAAIFQRGIPFVQIPTTLLAQVDSSVGGKVAVNHPLGKNMIGAFYQPRGVLIDTATLRTLAAREISAGLAEVVKYGLLGDADFFNWNIKHLAALRALEPAALATAIAHSCRAKARIVEADETETGARALLNFGHTFGHAIEAGLGYGEWLHGEAVGAGMVAAARLSGIRGCLSAAEVLRVESAIRATGCPCELPPLGAARYWELMQRDKKVTNGKLPFILLRRIGDAEIVRGLTLDDVREVLR